ncbi:hypothetical protein HK101_005801, partial [Irineochytrium annulatum]
MDVLSVASSPFDFDFNRAHGIAFDDELLSQMLAAFPPQNIYQNAVANLGGFGHQLGRFEPLPLWNMDVGWLMMTPTPPVASDNLDQLLSLLEQQPSHTIDPFRLPNASPLPYATAPPSPTSTHTSTPLSPEAFRSPKRSLAKKTRQQPRQQRYDHLPSPEASSATDGVPATPPPAPIIIKTTAVGDTILFVPPPPPVLPPGEIGFVNVVFRPRADGGVPEPEEVPEDRIAESFLAERPPWSEN